MSLNYGTLQWFAAMRQLYSLNQPRSCPGG